jgi:hypothetical protein
MYLPENHAQMFDILSELRLYAAMNGLTKLAEELDDVLLLLAREGGVRAEANRRATAGTETL